MTDEIDQNYCLFCGESVTVENHRVGLFEQIGEIDCESCGAEYRVELSVSEDPDR